MKRSLLRAASVLAAALVATGMAASGVSASPSAAQRFSVTSGDSCAYGYTEGQLEWRSTAPTAVRLTGLVGDRPFQPDPGAICRDDNRFSVATYTAYAGDRRVDVATQRVNNGTVRVDVVLGANTVLGVDRVVIQVCRVSLFGTTPTPDYCGRAHTYTPSTFPTVSG